MTDCRNLKDKYNKSSDDNCTLLVLNKDEKKTSENESIN